MSKDNNNLKRPSKSQKFQFFRWKLFSFWKKPWEALKFGFYNKLIIVEVLAHIKDMWCHSKTSFCHFPVILLLNNGRFKPTNLVFTKSWLPYKLLKMIKGIFWNFFVHIGPVSDIWRYLETSFSNVSVI